MLTKRAKHLNLIREERLDMPLTMAASGEINTVKRINGKDETRRFLENL